ncbi:protein-glutamate methylesterase/protein-glutamine glutaminase [Metabacillus indicus]|uniref:protein-glutamate methylesterase/protein-glutamine glutaminase n=1 Tax=Metabacillus indicus TaxID=246786 RepID=UPI0039842B00
MNKTSVLVVDDSAFMRKLIAGFLNESGTCYAAGTARNGEDALEKVKALNPDVVTLDIEMPGMDGLQTLKRIMEGTPKPVIMFSGMTQRGADLTIQSLQMGAVDFIPKPSGAISLDLHKVKDDLIRKVEMAGQLKMKSITVNERNRPFNERKTSRLNSSMKVICIGTSTGGPRALQQVLPKLPADLNAPVFVVQHMPEGFTASLAARLDTLSHLTVKEAEDGELVKKATAYIAPGGTHMKVEESKSGLMIRLSKESLNTAHRPSVDVLFESLSLIKNVHKIAVIMTGMGSDGSEGLKKLKQSGSLHAISESEKTSVVFGMPKMAVETNAVDAVEHLEDIADAILKSVQS